MNTVKNKKAIGVWMDHAQAKLLHYEEENPIIEVIPSGFDSRVRFKGETKVGANLGDYRSTNNDAARHAKENQALKTYYKKLAEKLHPYNDILVFGPTSAHKEFFNVLMEDKAFEGKRITSKDADYLTRNELIYYVSKWMD